LLVEHRWPIHFREKWKILWSNPFRHLIQEGVPALLGERATRKDNAVRFQLLEPSWAREDTRIHAEYAVDQLPAIRRVAAVV
jgi:hypothetical protein